jgi:crotonobetainyl-CoA:carnitine CoA-transferase CaiB-like acyl-CoA transferase
MTFDSYAGLLPPVRDEKGRVRVPKVFDPVGIKAGPLYAAIGTLAAVVRARATGEPALVEVAQADAAVAWNQAPLEDWMNGAFTRDLYSDESLYDAVRYSYYEAADGGLVFFQATEERFFKNFCNAVGRPDLIERFPGAAYDPAVGNDELRDELVEIFASRPLVEWMDLFIDANVVGGPGYDFEHLINDAHFKDRGLRYTSVDPDVGAVELIASPIKVEEEDFSAAPAPRMGEHTREVLSDTLGLSEAAIQSVMSASFASTERSR